jgi:hypothetical protein
MFTDSSIINRLSLIYLVGDQSNIASKSGDFGDRWDRRDMASKSGNFDDRRKFVFLMKKTKYL